MVGRSLVADPSSMVTQREREKGGLEGRVWANGLPFHGAGHWGISFYTSTWLKGIRAKPPLKSSTFKSHNIIHRLHMQLSPTAVVKPRGRPFAQTLPLLLWNCTVASLPYSPTPQ